ncbi:MAG: hypothetical protein Q8Q06_01995 [bacterium]|nr:hypothetical protein [bacterium]
MEIPTSPEEKKQKQNQEFERLVKTLVADSSSLPAKELSSGKKLDVVSAIENNDLSFYVGERVSDKTKDAIDCLIAIYDELAKDEPEHDFIEETVEQLKGYL